MTKHMTLDEKEKLLNEKQQKFEQSSFAKAWSAAEQYIPKLDSMTNEEILIAMAYTAKIDISSLCVFARHIGSSRVSELYRSFYDVYCKSKQRFNYANDVAVCLLEKIPFEDVTSDFIKHMLFVAPQSMGFLYQRLSQDELKRLEPIVMHQNPSVLKYNQYIK